MYRYLSYVCIYYHNKVFVCVSPLYVVPYVIRTYAMLPVCVYMYRRPINHLQCGQHIYVKCTYGRLYEYLSDSACLTVRRYRIGSHCLARQSYLRYIHIIKPRTTCAKRIKKLLINIPEASQVIYFRGVQKNDFIKTFNLFTFIYSFCVYRISIHTRTYYYYT